MQQEIESATMKQETLLKESSFDRIHSRLFCQKPATQRSQSAGLQARNIVVRIVGQGKRDMQLCVVGRPLLTLDDVISGRDKRYRTDFDSKRRGSRTDDI